MPEFEKKMRQRQWVYLGPILASPFAHIAVSLYRSAKTVRQKQLVIGVGVVGSTAFTLGMRLYLMKHAGFPGTNMDENTAQDRLVTVKSDTEKQQIEHPGMWAIIKEAFKGFG